MQQITIDEFSDTYTVNVPKNTSYIQVEAYDSNEFHYVDITDSTIYQVIENANFNTIVLAAENFLSGQFPLIITTFSDSDTVGGVPLFDRASGIPLSTMRLAVGKRNNPSRNVTYEDFANYVNEGGGAYVTKDFGGLDYDIARGNLNIYSKGEIDALRQEYEYSNVTFDMTRDDALRFGDTYTGYPFIQTPQTQSSRTNCHNTLHTYFDKGMCGFELTFTNVKTYSNYQLNPCFFSDIQGLFNGRQFTTQTPIIITPTVKVNGGTDTPAYFRRGYLYGTTLSLTGALANNMGQYPVMIITPDYSIRFANTVLNPNSVYFVDLNWNYIIGGNVAFQPTGISWYSTSAIDTTKYDFTYTCAFAPNDPQLN